MADLLQDIRKKDKKAIQLIYDCYGKRLYGYAIRQWKLEEDEAWEMVYQTIYKTIEVIDRYTFENEKKFAGFVFTMFCNNLRNLYHKKKQTHAYTVELNDAHGSLPLEEEQPVVPDSLHMICLQQGLAGMEDWKRIVLLMRAQDHSYEEIAAYVKRPAEQLKVYFMRLKKILTEKINECISRKGQ
jgi:DNA-directed RNA polymerase specialized sigma24 family protein